MTRRFFDGFHHAFRGLRQLFKEEPHFRFQAIVAVFLMLAIVLLPLTYGEIISIIIAIVLVLGSEAVNTVIERFIDSISIERKRWIGSIKDMMASVVLINSIGALCIGIITLVHYTMRTVGVGSLKSLDRAIFMSLNTLAGRTALMDMLIIFFASTLAPILVAIFIVTVSISAISFRQKIYRLMVVGVSGLVARFGITAMIRFLHPRARPFMVHHVYQLIAEQGSSFPSGHASFFFAVSTAVFMWNKRLGLVFFGLSLLMGICRVIAGVHYPSDIFGGMVVGVASGLLVGYAATLFMSKKS